MIKIGTISTNAGSGISSLNVSHTVTQQNNRMLLVAVHVNDGSDTDPVVSGITFNGSALTLINSAHRGGAGIKSHTELWRLIAPSVGTFNVVITMAGSCDNLGAEAYELYNAMQQAPEASGTNNLNGVSYISTNVTSISGEALVIDAVTANSAITFTPDAGQTEQYDSAINGAGRMVGSKKIPANGSANTIGQTSTANTRLTQCVAVLTGIHEINVSDSVSIAENRSLFLGTLSVNVLDPFYCTITEHIDIIDLVVEVGIVMDAVVVSNQYAYLILTVLNLNYSDNVSVVENFEVLLPILNYEAQEVTIFIAEDISLSLDLLFIECDEQIMVAEEVELSLNILCVDVLDPFHCLITEHAQILDLVVELGVVMEAIYVQDIDIDILLDSLHLSTDEDISVVECIRTATDALFIEDDFDTVIVDDLTEIVLSELNTEHYDDIIIDDFVSIEVDNLFSLVSDDILVTEEALAEVDVLFSEVSDDIVIIENSDNSLDQLWMFTQDDVVSVDDSAEVSLDILNINVQDEYGVLVTEHAEIIDGQRAIGVIATFAHIQEWTRLYLDVLVPMAIDMPYTFPQYKVDEWINIYIPLAISVDDSITISEYVFWITSVKFNIYDQIIAQETVTMVIDPQFTVTDTVAISESVIVAESSAPVTFSINVFDNISISESKAFYLDELFLSIFEQITVSEYFNLIDLVVEIPLLIDSATITESVNLVVSYSSILSLSVFESIVWLGDFLTFGFDPLAVDVYETIGIAEYANIFDIIVELEAGESVAVIEFINVPAPFESGDIDVQSSDDITVDDFAQVYPIILRVLSIENILIGEAVSVDIGNLWLQVFSAITINETIIIDVEKNLECQDVISVTESAYLLTEGFIPRPPFIFDFHRYPTDSITFEYDSRTITLPY